MSYLRDRSRVQNDRSILIAQDNFGGGLNVDIPATDINNNEAIGLENYIAFERYLEGRSGTVEIEDLDAEGDVTQRELFATPFYHKKQKCLLYVAGNYDSDFCYVYRQSGSTKQRVKTFIEDVDLTVGFGCSFQAFGENALLIDGDQIYLIYVENGEAKSLRMNVAIPDDTPIQVDDGTKHTYKYVATFSYIIDTTTGLPLVSGNRFSPNAKVLLETPPIFQTDFFSFSNLSNPLSSDDPHFIYYEGFVADGYFVSFYRTPDLGFEGLSNIYYSEFAWVGDTNTTYFGTYGLNDDVDDSVLKQRLSDPTFRLNTIGMLQMRDYNASPDSTGLLRVTDNFVFHAFFNQSKLYYSQRTPSDSLVGYYNPAFQFKEFKEPIKALLSSKDNLIVICARSIHIVPLNSYINSSGTDSVYTLNQFSEVESEIGVVKIGSIAEISNGSFIAICSDNSVRIWDGAGWSKDYASDKVKRLIDRNNENLFEEGVDGVSVKKRRASSNCSVFYKGAYYIWFNKDETLSYPVESYSNIFVPDYCLRLSLTNSSGKGWTRYSGEHWIMPYGEYGVFIADDFTKQSGNGHEYLFAVNREDRKIYWIETFDGEFGYSIGPNNFPIVKYYKDKYSNTSDGYDILCRFKSGEMTGSRENFVSIHQESHAYLRDLLDPEENDLSNYPVISYEALKIDARAYVDGKMVSTETAGQVSSGDDISFGFRIEGSRISIEFEVNRSGHQLRSVDHRLRIQDKKRPYKGVSSSVARNFQTEYQSSLSMWVATRPNPFLERVALSELRRSGLAQITAPDGKSNGIEVTASTITGSRIVKQNSTIFNAFTCSLWIKTPTFTNGGISVLFKINGTQPLTVTLNGSNIISSLEFGGSVSIEAPSLAAGNVNGWSQIIFVRGEDSSSMEVYQNDELKGSLPVNALFGGGDIEIAGVL